jgi:hypothetical protein
MDKIFFGTEIVGENGETKGYFKSPADALAAQGHWSFEGAIMPCNVLVDSDESSIRRNAVGQVIGMW